MKEDHLRDRASSSVENDVMTQREFHKDVLMDPYRSGKLGMQAPFDQAIRSIVRMPGLHEGRSINYDSSTPPVEDMQHIIHMMTPESATKTHYFWAIAFDSVLDDPDFLARMQAVGEGAFYEDKSALEDIEDIYRRDHRANFREKIIRSDEGSIRVLRLIDSLAQKEAAERDRHRQPSPVPA